MMHLARTGHRRLACIIIAALTPPVLAAACSSKIVAPEHSGGAGGTAAAGAGGSDIGGGGGRPEMIVDASQGWVYDGPQYDGDQSCAPKKTNSLQDVSCCEGVPCQGNCELHDGTWQCICYGIDGGCGSYGMICCIAGCTVHCDTLPP